MKKYKYEMTFTFEGKRYRIRADTKKELAVKEYKKRQELESGRSAITRHMLVRDWAKVWLETYKEPSVSAETLALYRSIIKIYINDPLGSYRLSDVKPIQLQGILNNMQGMSKSRIKRVRATFDQIFSTAVKNHLLHENPAEGLTFPACEDKSRRSITPQERAALLKVCQNHYTAPWVLTLLYTGIRPAESAALQCRNVDLKNKILTVDSAFKRITRTVGATKTKAGHRSIPIPNALIGVLGNLISERPGPFDYVFCSKRGLPLNDKSIRTMWKDFLLAMNEELGGRNEKGHIFIRAVADDLVPYSLRHTFCTDLQDAGVPINVAKELMGHTDISITSKIYTHHSEISFENARNKMNDLHSRGANPKKGVAGGVPLLR